MTILFNEKKKRFYSLRLCQGGMHSNEYHNEIARDARREGWWVCVSAVVTWMRSEPWIRTRPEYARWLLGTHGTHDCISCVADSRNVNKTLMCYGMLNFGCVEQWVITIIGGEYNRLSSNILRAHEQKHKLL